jgi:CubicO group peptidase (beta-lactamase class C family)
VRWDGTLPRRIVFGNVHFSRRSIGHLGYTGTSLWIDLDRKLAVTLLTNRTWPDRSSQAIRAVRPAFHDAVVNGLSQL